MTDKSDTTIQLTPMERAMTWERMSGERLSDAERKRIMAGGEFVLPVTATQKETPQSQMTADTRCHVHDGMHRWVDDRCVWCNSERQRPPHPLVSDRETKLFRYVTHNDIRRWEVMEMRYNNLIATLKDAINVERS